jgi:hypothetical protein
MGFWTYLRDLTKAFFKWWWAVITGIASLLPFFGFPGPSITVSNVVASIVILITFSLLFLTISVMVQGYEWYTDTHNEPVVESCIPARSSSEPEVLRIRSTIPLEPGQVITVLRTTDRGTGCLGMVKVDRLVEPLLYQCAPLWISPLHKNDLAQGRVHVSQLSATFLLNETDLLSFAKEVSEL